jgi:hypothetical protein
MRASFLLVMVTYAIAMHTYIRNKAFLIAIIIVK